MWKLKAILRDNFWGWEIKETSTSLKRNKTLLFNKKYYIYLGIVEDLGTIVWETSMKEAVIMAIIKE